MSDSAEQNSKSNKDNSVEGEDSQSSTSVEARPDSKKSSASIPLSYLIFVLLLGVGGFCFMLWTKIQQVHVEQQQILTKARDEIRSVEAKLDKNETAFQAFKKASEFKVNELRRSVIKLGSLAGRGRMGWVLAEVEFLLLVANHQVGLGGNIKTAIQALTEADERLHSLGDPRTLATRKFITTEVLQLKKIVLPDITGMVLKLDGFSKKVGKLSLAYASRETLQGGLKTKSEPEATDKKEKESTLDKALGKLKTLVVVRKLDTPIKPMLNREQEVAIRQVLELKLQSARVALLQKDQKRFRSALEASQAWLQKHFYTGNKDVQTMQYDIKQLSNIELKPLLPKISGSLGAVRLLLQQTSKSAPKGDQ